MSTHHTVDESYRQQRAEKQMERERTQRCALKRELRSGATVGRTPAANVMRLHSHRNCYYRALLMKPA